MSPETEIEITVVGRRCVYIGDHRVAGGKPYVSEDLPQTTFKTRVSEILCAIETVPQVLAEQNFRECVEAALAPARAWYAKEADGPDVTIYLLNNIMADLQSYRSGQYRSGSAPSL